MAEPFYGTGQFPGIPDADPEEAARRFQEFNELTTAARNMFMVPFGAEAAAPSIPAITPPRPGPAQDYNLPEQPTPLMPQFQPYDPEMIARQAVGTPSPTRLEGQPVAAPPSAATQAAVNRGTGGYRAVRLPGGQIVFTNQVDQYAREGAETLSQDDTVAEAQKIGAAGPQITSDFPRAERTPFSQPSLAEQARENILAGKRGNATQVRLAPDEEGNFTPGYFNQLMDAARQREALGEARAAAEYAALPVEERHRMRIEQEAAKRPNHQQAILTYVQNEFQKLNRERASLQQEASVRYPNDRAAQDRHVKLGEARIKADEEALRTTLQMITRFTGFIAAPQGTAPQAGDGQ